MRYREKSDPRSLTMEYWHLNGDCSQTTWTRTGIGSVGKLGQFQSMYDVVTPRWSQRKAAGEIVMNPMSSRKVEISGGGTGFHIKSKGTSCGNPVLYHEYKVVGPWLVNKVSSGPALQQPLQVALDPTVTANLLREVSTCMWNRRGRQPSNLWETVAEARQLRSLLPGLGSSALGVIAKLGKQRFQSAAGFYLAARYGLMPIISDTENVLKALEKTIGKIRNKVKCENMVSAEAASAHYWLHDHIRTSYSIATTHKVYAKCISIDEVEMSMANRLGFTAKGLVTLPWELLTLSFVVDWFVNVGDYLGALAPSPGWNQLGTILCVTEEIVNTVTALGDTEDTQLYSILSPVQGSATIKVTTEWRQAPYPPSLVVRPKFGLFDGGLRDADAFFLAGQKLSKLIK